MRDIVDEPVGPVYLDLLSFAERHSEYFSLVWRHQLTFDDDAAAVEVALRAFLVEQLETDEWPGTRLIGHSAILRKYRVCRNSMRELAQAERLYAWLSPRRPEDLAFYGGRGSAWLGSIAHERDAFIILGATEMKALEASVPGLRMRPRAG